jgi:ElaB/YqjD/DUF883 family membrane-anchored ribosome-binding protein
MTTPRDDARTRPGDDLEATSSAIRADIERTRERLGETVEALGAQLNPTHLKQRVKDSVREATIGRVQNMASTTRDRITGSSRDLAQHIRDNPLPAAVAAAGIGWLLFRAREGERPLLRKAVRRRLADAPERFDDEFDAYEGRALRADVGEFGEEVRERTRDLSERVQETRQRIVERAEPQSARVAERVQEAKERASEVGHRLAERASEARQRVAQKARDARHAVAERASETSRRVRESARHTAQRVETSYNESPIGMGAVALAIGLAIGYSLPATRREARMMGDSRDKLVDKARERVADARERIEGAVERATPEVKAAIRDAARDTGLTR